MCPLADVKHSPDKSHKSKSLNYLLTQIWEYYLGEDSLYIFTVLTFSTGNCQRITIFTSAGPL